MANLALTKLLSVNKTVVGNGIFIMLYYIYVCHIITCEPIKEMYGAVHSKLPHFSSYVILSHITRHISYDDCMASIINASAFTYWYVCSAG